MFTGAIGMYVLSYSISHFNLSSMMLYSNSIITYTGSSYGIYLGWFICLEIMSLTISIYPLPILYWTITLFNHMTLHSMFDDVSFWILDYCKWSFAVLVEVEVEY